MNRSHNFNFEKCLESESDSKKRWTGVDPVSSEISDLCEIYDLLLFVCCFASQSEEIKFRGYFFDVCCIN